MIPAAPHRPHGVRIRFTDPRLRGALLKIPDSSRPVVRPDGTVGPKTYHLRLDGEGSVIVSPTVLERLRALPWREAGHGVQRPPLSFEVVNDVVGPPTQRVGGGVEAVPSFMLGRDLDAEGIAEVPSLTLKDH